VSVVVVEVEKRGGKGVCGWSGKVAGNRVTQVGVDGGGGKGKGTTGWGGKDAGGRDPTGGVPIARDASRGKQGGVRKVGEWIRIGSQVDGGKPGEIHGDGFRNLAAGFAGGERTKARRSIRNTLER